MRPLARTFLVSVRRYKQIPNLKKTIIRPLVKFKLTPHRFLPKKGRVESLGTDQTNPRGGPEAKAQTHPIVRGLEARSLYLGLGGTQRSQCTKEVPVVCGFRWSWIIFYIDSWIGCFFCLIFFRLWKKNVSWSDFFLFFFSRVMFVCVEKQETKNPLTMRACFLHF